MSHQFLRVQTRVLSDALLRRNGGIHVLHVGKTGGTAVREAFRLARPKVPVYLHPHRTRLAMVPSRHTAVIFLRDPAARFVSAFNSRQRQGKPSYNAPWTEAEAAAFTRFERASDLALGLSSSSPRVLADAVVAMKSIGHVRDPFTYWLGQPERLAEVQSRKIFVGTQENLRLDIERLSEMIGCDLVLPEVGQRSHSSPSTADKLEGEALLNIKAWYGADYAWMHFLVDSRR